MQMTILSIFLKNSKPIEPLAQQIGTDQRFLSHWNTNQTFLHFSLQKGNTCFCLQPVSEFKGKDKAQILVTKTQQRLTHICQCTICSDIPATNTGRIPLYKDKSLKDYTTHLSLQPDRVWKRSERQCRGQIHLY